MKIQKMFLAVLAIIACGCLGFYSLGMIVAEMSGDIYYLNISIPKQSLILLSSLLVMMIIVRKILPDNPLG